MNALASAPTRWAFRNTAVAMASALVLAFLAVFALAPSQSAFAATTGKSKVASKDIVFYGKVVDAKNKPLANARVVVYHYHGGRQYIDKVLYTAKDGTWKYADKRTHSGRWHVQVTRTVGKKWLKTNAHFNAKVGHAYKVNVKVVKKGVFAHLPVAHY